jgi:hypothetical protein
MDAPISGRALPPLDPKSRRLAHAGGHSLRAQVTAGVTPCSRRHLSLSPSCDVSFFDRDMNCNARGAIWSDTTFTLSTAEGGTFQGILNKTTVSDGDRRTLLALVRSSR